MARIELQLLTGPDAARRPRGHFYQPVVSDVTSPAAGLGRLFEAVVLSRSDALAVTTSSQNWSYRDLHSAAAAVATRLRSVPGFRRGDRVLLVVANSPEYIAAFYGVLLAGGVVVPFPPKSEANLLRQIWQSTEAAALITTTRIRNARPELRELASQTIDLDGGTAKAVAVGEEAPAGDQLAAIFFTAGSTGIPKGVMLSHENLISNARAIQQYLGIGPDERPLCVLPFQHAFGNSVLHSHLLAGPGSADHENLPF